MTVKGVKCKVKNLHATTGELILTCHGQALENHYIVSCDKPNSSSDELICILKPQHQRGRTESGFMTYSSKRGN